MGYPGHKLSEPFQQTYSFLAWYWYDRGRMPTVEDVAVHLALDVLEAEHRLKGLWEKRLIRKEGSRYVFTKAPAKGRARA